VIGVLATPVYCRMFLDRAILLVQLNFTGQPTFRGSSRHSLLVLVTQPSRRLAGPQIRVTWENWCAQVTSDVVGSRLADDDAFPPAAIHAAAMGLAECFQYWFTKNPLATRRTWTTSLYRPDFKDNPLDMSGPTAPLLLPTNFG